MNAHSNFTCYSSTSLNSLIVLASSLFKDVVYPCLMSIGHDFKISDIEVILVRLIGMLGKC